MAHMYPPELDQTTQSKAERRLYAEFRDQLPDKYTVFHSARWLMRDKRRGTADGESDFVIVDPQRGVLVLEVKGGSIRTEDGRWYSNANPIKDPFQQATTGKHSLVRKVKEMHGWSGHRPYVCQAVAFPDTLVRQDLGTNAPREIILDHTDVTALPPWLDRVFDYHRGAQRADAPMTSNQIGLLCEMLAPSRRLTLPLGEQLQHEGQRIIELTEEQYRVLDLLRYQRRVAIRGSAGTGKTVLARERARRLGAEGFRVLLTCFNGYLAGYLRGNDELGSDKDMGLSQVMPNVTVLNFHKVCEKMARLAGLPFRKPSGMASDEWYQKRLPLILLEAAGALGPQYDAIVVDEGQDFGETYWEPLQMLLKDPEESLLYVFYDDNQNLYQSGLSIPSDLQQYPLTRNCRNTQRILESFLPFYSAAEGRLPTSIGPKGRPVEVAYCESGLDVEKLLRLLLHRLTVEERVATSDIVVLSSHRHRGILKDLPRLGNVRLTQKRSSQPGEIRCTTINYFKGLESPVVIVLLYSSEHQDPQRLLYVGCSRARSHLVILAEGELPDRVRQRLPPSGQ